MQKRRQKDSEQEGKDDSKESMCSRYHRPDVHMNSQTVAEEQGLHGFKPDGVLVLRGEVDTSPHP